MPKITIDVTDAEKRALEWEFLTIQDVVKQRAVLAIKRMAEAARNELPDETDFNDEDIDVVKTTSLKSAKERNEEATKPML